MDKSLNIIGGGMAGCEAAWQAANMGIDVTLFEMRPKVKTFAHQTEKLGEMVCSNSFRSNDHEQNAVGLLHWEMLLANGLIINTAYQNKLPAGGALAVDREEFADTVTSKINSHPNIRISNEEIATIPTEGQWIVATGPLTSSKLANSIAELSGTDALAFFDAIAPIVYFDTINMSKAWMQSRYDKGETEEERTAYLNCPMSREQYYQFIDALLAADKTEFKDGETANYFDGCLPIEVMAERGIETLRFGPMKPVGLTNPHSEEKPYAVVQLRRDNALGTLYNIVGFQTKMKYGAQKEILRMIPGLEEAKFARLGGIHRNSFINSPSLLDKQLRFKVRSNIRFAGQITGVEGYVESASIGLLSGRLAALEILKKDIPDVPVDTAIGSLVNHITGGANAKTFQPMNVNFGLFPVINGVKGGRKGRVERYKAYTERAKSSWSNWLSYFDGRS
ncbi:methylenetetrahydrofolate--tRNA-(uracil(54)-C(5))-methyltransferase (FADH(2)-oxidizing) TrmFO [Paracoccaceae bacterium]|nr:methylenetetrahydrofolate--tRNA-(uracil(54)-C(5))-methyltransferase (FADH(2)-oxidizing) TrmFO [Paracoccaceae bacterium]